MYKVLFISLSLASALVTGCASLGIGESEFSCPGKPNGVKCQSAWNVYEDTHNGNIPKSNIKNGEVDNEEEGGKKAQTLSKEKPDFIIDNYVSPRLPDKSIPVRTPAQVMRIWVAPYEDVEGDFIVSGHAYTEIEPRKWTLGVKDVKSAERKVFEPLKSKQK